MYDSNNNNSSSRGGDFDYMFDIAVRQDEMTAIHDQCLRLDVFLLYHGN